MRPIFRCANLKLRVYISGLAAHEDLNMFEVNAGDDVNFPTEDTETFYA